MERLVAEAALKGLVAGVLTHVRDQVAALGERLAAHYALVRFLTCNTKSRKVVRCGVAVVALSVDLRLRHDSQESACVSCLPDSKSRSIERVSHFKTLREYKISIIYLCNIYI